MSGYFTKLHKEMQELHPNLTRKERRELLQARKTIREFGDKNDTE